MLLDAEDVLHELNTHLALLQEKENQQDAVNITKKSEFVLNEQGNKHYTTLSRDIDFRVPVFDGTYAKYMNFITAFNIKTDRPGISKAQKFFVLKDHLSNGPQLLLQGCEPSDAFYDKDI